LLDFGTLPQKRDYFIAEIELATAHLAGAKSGAASFPQRVVIQAQATLQIFKPIRFVGSNGPSLGRKKLRFHR
jgi:hypothetical protein